MTVNYIKHMESNMARKKRLKICPETIALTLKPNAVRHRINCDAVITELVDAGLAYFDDETKPRWTPAGQSEWQDFYAVLATTHESWQCLAYGSVLLDQLAGFAFQSKT